MTRAGFPHSDILGSRFVCQLPEAYRRLPRPSSAPSAKASTLCPYKLDHKDHSKMLASTVQFSSYDRVTHLFTSGRLPTPRWTVRRTRRPAGRRAPHRPQATQVRDSTPRSTTFRLFPQDPTACQADPVTPMHLRSLPTEAGVLEGTGTRPAVVDVPPSSTTPSSCGRGVGLDTTSPPMTGEPGARCSLERR